MKLVSVHYTADLRSFVEQLDFSNQGNQVISCKDLFGGTMTVQIAEEENAIYFSRPVRTKLPPHSMWGIDIFAGVISLGSLTREFPAAIRLAYSIFRDCVANAAEGDKISFIFYK